MESYFTLRRLERGRMELVTKTLWKTRNNDEMPDKSSNHLTPDAIKGNLPESDLTISDGGKKVQDAPDVEAGLNRLSVRQVS